MTYKKMSYIIFVLLMAVLCTLIIISVTRTEYLLIPYIASLLFILIYILKGTDFLSTTFFFIIFYIMLFYLQPIYCYSLDQSILPYPLEVHRIYALITINGVFAFILGNSLKYGKSVRNYKVQNINLRHLDLIKNLIFLITMVAIAFVLFNTGIGTLLHGSRLGLRKEMGYVGLTMNYLGYIVSVLIFLVFYSIKNSKRKSLIYSWLIILLTIEVFYIYTFRLRSFLVGHFLSGVMGVYFSDFFNIEKEIKKNSILISKQKLLSKKLRALVCFACILLLAVTFRFLRGFMESGQSILDFKLDIKYFLERSIFSGDLGYAHRVMELITIVPSKYGYLKGQSYYRLLFTLIPRFVWKDKPLNTQRIVALWLRPDVAGLTLPPGINGDLYINFGMVGVLFMIVFGSFLKKIDSGFDFHKAIVWSASPVWIFHLVRGGFTNPLVIFFLIYLVAYVIAKGCAVRNEL
jgi:hypothetical protein